MLTKMSNLFKIKIKDVVGACVSAVIVGVLVYVASLASPVAEFDWSKAIDIAILTGVASLLKSFSTDESGKFLGGVEVK